MTVGRHHGHKGANDFHTAAGHAEVRPLSGVRVVDLCVGPTAVIARKFAELGADVVCVRDPSRYRDRESGYVFGGEDIEEIGGNLGKRLVELSVDDPLQRGWLDRLIDSADLLIENAVSHPDEAIRVDIEAARARSGALVVLSANDFGLAGRFANWRGADIVYLALNGVLSRSGGPGRPPLPPPGQIALACAAAQAVCVALTALYSRWGSGKGDHLDLSLLDASTEVFDPGYGVAGSAMMGMSPSQLPTGRIDASHQYPVIACADGHVRLCILAPRQWQAMFQWMGRPEEFADPSFNNLRVRFASKDLIPAIGQFLADKTCADIESEAQAIGVPAATLNDFDEVLANPHGIARGALRQLDLVGAVASYPDGAWEIDGQRMTLGARAWPTGPVGEAEDFWLAPARFDSESAEFDCARPLAGLRVLDLGVIVVGAEQGRYFADLGADVVKVESATYADGARQGVNDAGMSVSFAAGHRNKRSLGLNLRDPAGKALFLDLVAKADVVLSNFKPGTMESLGFGFDVLAKINPGIITSESSAFGSSGPWQARMGYGPLVRAASGLTANWKYDSDVGSLADGVTVYPDHVAGRYGIAGVLALLIRRRFTGTGGRVSASQLEICQGHLGLQIAARSLERQGVVSDIPTTDAPAGIFPTGGEDQWCAVAVSGTRHWQGLCRALGRTDLGEDPALATARGRANARKRIDEALTSWLASRSPDEAMSTLQSHGVPAGAMYRVSELPGAPIFEERDLFRETEHPALADRFYLENAPVRSTQFTDPPARPAPILAQHTDEVLADWLGLDASMLARLHVEGTLEASKYATS